jgi:hypothetical protein
MHLPAHPLFSRTACDDNPPLFSSHSNTNEEVWEKLMAYGGEHDDEAVKETARLVAVVRAAEDVAGASYSRPTDDDNGPKSGA